jgi:hypothetical protein
MQEGRLAKIKGELTNLDQEIASIHRDLGKPVPASQKPPRTVTKLPNPRLLAQPHRPEFIEDDPSFDDIIRRRHVHIPGYRPPSERIFEARELKKKKVSELAANVDREHQQQCPFTPEIQSAQLNVAYDPGHLFQPRKVQRPEPVNEEKHVCIDQTDTIFSRQKNRKLQVEVPLENRKTIQPEAEEAMVTRLSKPKPFHFAAEESEIEVPKVVPQATIDRLVADSIKRQPPSEPRPVVIPSFINKRSQELTKGVKTDVYEESLAAKARVRDDVKLEREWRELANRENDPPSPVVAFPKIDITKKCDVAGTEDHLERMRRAREDEQEEPEVEVERPKVIVIQPFSFEQRERERKIAGTFNVREVLAEINEILAGAGPDEN